MRFTSYFAIFFGSSGRTGSFCWVGSTESSSGSDAGVCAFEPMAATSTTNTQRKLKKVSWWRLTSRAEQDRMGPPHLGEARILQRVQEFWERKNAPDGLILAAFGGLRLQALQEGIRLSHAWEKLFLGLKLRGMDAPAAAAQLDGVFQVEHFVVDDVIQHVPRHGGMIEDTADDDGVVRGIVVAEDAAGLGLAPAHAGTGHQAMEKAAVQVLKDGLEIVEVAAGGAQQFAAAHLADKVGLADDFMARDVFAVTRGLPPIDRAAVHLGQQNVRDSLQNCVGSSFQQVGEADQQAAVAQPDGVVDVGKGEELNLEFGQGSAWTELGVGLLEDFEDAGAHGERRLARDSGH